MAFDHENLRVYQEAIRFIAWLEPLFEGLSKQDAVFKQLDRASTSIALNIAEGNGRYTGSDRCHFFDIARGSALECSACLDVLVAKGRVGAGQIEPGKQMLHSTVSMLVKLIQSNSNRVCEAQVPYGDESRSE